MVHDENQYLLMRQQLLAQPTTSEHARASRIANQMDYNNPISITDPLIQAKIVKAQQTKKSSTSIIIHYTYEQRFAHYQSNIHKIWNSLFLETSVLDNKLIVGTRNRPNLTQELVRRCPYPPKSKSTNES